jgi:hypothetical protein
MHEYYFSAYTYGCVRNWFNQVKYDQSAKLGSFKIAPKLATRSLLALLTNIQLNYKFAEEAISSTVKMLFNKRFY